MSNNDLPTNPQSVWDPNTSSDSNTPTTVQTPTDSQATSGFSTTTGYGHKEIEPLRKEAVSLEESDTQLVELDQSPELDSEVEGWIEKVERDPNYHNLQQPVVIDEQVLVADASAQVIDDYILLPLTERSYEIAKKASVSESKRWLATWSDRISKLFSGHTQFLSD